MEVEAAQEWKDRANRFSESVTDAIAWYRKQMWRAWYAHRITSVLVLILSVLAPIFVAGAGTSAQGIVLGFTANEARAIALWITVALALLEGLRRLFRFEQRWSSCFWARNGLRRARDEYRTSQIDIAVGSAQWVANFEAFRKAYYEITDKESRDLFRMDSDKDENPSENGRK